MLDLNMVTKILLMSCNEIVLIPVIISGFLAIDRKNFGHTYNSINVYNDFKFVFEIYFSSAACSTSKY